MLYTPMKTHRCHARRATFAASPPGTTAACASAAPLSAASRAADARTKACTVATARALRSCSRQSL